MFKTVKNNKRLGINSAKNVKLGGIYKILSGFVGNVGPTYIYIYIYIYINIYIYIYI